MMNTLTALAVSTVVGAAIGASLVSATPIADAQPTTTATVDGVDYPLCTMEDCSDQPNQVGIWTDATGAQWLSLGDYSVAITR